MSEINFNESNIGQSNMNQSKMGKYKITAIEVLTAITIVILMIVSLAGVLSMDFTKSYEATNQYGQTIKMFGSGIYAHDSYFVAPILIGTDIIILFLVVPILLVECLKNRKNHTDKTKLKLLATFSVVLYYATSISFGVTYNRFHLLYIALFSISLFTVFALLRSIDRNKINAKVTEQKSSKGISIFLILTGVALIVAWLPDIIPTLISGSPLLMIEVYTTQITYVLDMGIIAPMCMVCLSLLKKKDGLGNILLAVLFKLCMIVGVMMITQTACQIASNVEVPLPALITKSATFVVLALFAKYFNKKYFYNL